MHYFSSISSRISHLNHKISDMRAKFSDKWSPRGGGGRGGFSISSTSSRTLSKFHRFVSENKIIMITMKMRFMMKRIINDFQPVALPGDFI